jgi:hypothetical protein
VRWGETWAARVPYDETWVARVRWGETWAARVPYDETWAAHVHRGRERRECAAWETG